MADSSTKNAITLNCFVSGDEPSNTFPVRISPSSTAAELRKETSLAYQFYFDKEINPLKLFKIQVKHYEIHSFILPADAQALQFTELVEYYWPNGNESNNRMINILITPVPPKDAPQKESQNVTKSASSGTGLADLSLAEQNDKIQSSIIKHLKNQSSSAWARHSNFMKLQKTHYAIFNGRPAGATGLPVALYHPVFDVFTNGLDSTAVLPTQTYTLVNELLKASQDIYSNELGPGNRTESLKPILGKLLPPYIGIREAPGTKSDGLISAENGAPCMVMEIKNEVGAGGSDPTVQGAISYTKYWGEGQLDWIRHLCCCPSFILAISGPWMCILGAVMLDRPVIQPLTSFLWVANHPESAPQIHKIVRVFSSLSAAISKLQDFYAGFSRADPAANRHDPYQRYYMEDGTRVEFSYFRGFGPRKAVFPAQTKPPENQPGAERREIIVKFAESYHVDAHRLLAAEGLAPKLKFVSSEGDEGFKIGNLTMIVMERVRGENLADLKIDRLPECVIKDISRALRVLHDNDIVFGDLRPPNVMAVQDGKGNVTGGMLIDFDWCGTHGEAKYPPRINPSINWPEGVGPGTIMLKEHDQEMFANLF